MKGAFPHGDELILCAFELLQPFRIVQTSVCSRLEEQLQINPALGIPESFETQSEFVVLQSDTTPWRFLLDRVHFLGYNVFMGVQSLGDKALQVGNFGGSFS